MQLLEDRIRRDGKVAPGNVLRVDSFINHQMDIVLMEQLAQEFRRRFSGVRVDKVLTVEASGIAIATLVAQAFGVPLVFAKKAKTANLPDDVYAGALLHPRQRQSGHRFQGVPAQRRARAADR